MFVGRVNELKMLERIYSSGKFECVIVHGRMRAGKTALLREFAKNKKSIYFAAQETHSLENMADLSRSVEAFHHSLGERSLSIADYMQAFKCVADCAKSERIILILDDYHFLAETHKGISELICGQIDTLFAESKLMLIICGSSESVMENETLSFDSPYQGRRTAQIDLKPFTFFEAKRYYTGFSPFDIAVLYGVTGGVPKYLQLMDPELPVEENIRRAFFDPSSYLLEEPANFLRREVRDPAYYNAVLRAIATGHSRNSEIAAAIGLVTSATTAYLKNLISFGLIGKHTPMTEKAGRKTIYDMEDNFFRFWYRFVPDNLSYIKCGMTDKFWRSVARDIPSYMSDVFNDICRQWMHQQNQAGQLPLNFIEIGRWWGVDPAWNTDASIPIVAYSDDNSAIFGDCVWSDDPAGADVLASLIERSRLLRHANSYFYLFSRSGFSEECADLAQHFSANLVMFE